MSIDQISTESTESLGLSSFHERRRGLEEEHQWLLKQIKRKRTELKNFLDQMRSIGMELFKRVSPIQQQLQGLDEEIHELFSEILTTRKLGKKSRKDITGVYHSLQMMGVISPQLDIDSEEEDEEWLSDFEDVFSDAQEYKSAEKKTQKNADYDYIEEENEEPDFGSGEPKSNKSGEMRKTFLKLASLFHPDKANDPETELYHAGSNERSESGL